MKNHRWHALRMLAAELSIALSVPLEFFNIGFETREMELSNLGATDAETKGRKLGKPIRKISVVNS